MKSWFVPQGFAKLIVLLHVGFAALTARKVGGKQTSNMSTSKWKCYHSKAVMVDTRTLF
jgi:hypothetical protein